MVKNHRFQRAGQGIEGRKWEKFCIPAKEVLSTEP